MIKHIFILSLILCPIYAFAAHPIDECSDIGLATWEDYAIIIAKDTLTPETSFTEITPVTDTVGGGETRACGDGTGIPNSCVLYAPQSVTFSDNAGTYSYSNACYLD
ncbi:MAG: hypothetical protein IJA72_02880 [Clostridia bacterium]|nr:hypothetical protein [Clostridia bacterium]